jgi:hypothetical protein
LLCPCALCYTKQNPLKIINTFTVYTCTIVCRNTGAIQHTAAVCMYIVLHISLSPSLPFSPPPPSPSILLSHSLSLSLSLSLSFSFPTALPRPPRPGCVLCLLSSLPKVKTTYQFTGFSQSYN